MMNTDMAVTVNAMRIIHQQRAYQSDTDADVPKRFLGRKSTRRDHKEDVEDRRSDDSADSDVVLGEKNADYRGEELRRRPARCHECRASYIRRDLKLQNENYTVMCRKTE